MILLAVSETFGSRYSRSDTTARTGPTVPRIAGFSHSRVITRAIPKVGTSCMNYIRTTGASTMVLGIIRATKKPKSTSNHSSSKNLLAIAPKKGTSHLHGSVFSMSAVWMGCNSPIKSISYKRSASVNSEAGNSAYHLGTHAWSDSQLIQYLRRETATRRS